MARTLGRCPGCGFIGPVSLVERHAISCLKFSGGIDFDFAACYVEWTQAEAESKQKRIQDRRATLDTQVKDELLRWKTPPDFLEG